LLGFGKSNKTKMTNPNHNQNDSLLNQIVNQISLNGGDSLAEAVRLMLNHAMQIERSNALGAKPYERSDKRKGRANGFKPKTVDTRLGKITVAVPQVRDAEIDFYPSALERGCRSERALTATIAEMYIKGVSTRDVTGVLQNLAGTLHISSMQVSRATAELDEHLNLWRNRPLDTIEYPYLILDARYEKVRLDGLVRDCAVLVASGVDATGHRSILGVSVALSEAETHWKDFLTSLQDRGLKGVTYIVSDSHKGIAAARIARFPGVPWQRCQFHLQQNATQYVPKVSMRTVVAAELRDVLQAKTRELADARLQIMVSKYAKTAPKLSAWLQENVIESLTVFALPVEHRARMRTSNLAERINQEIKRRTRVVRVFPNEKSLLRLVTAILSEINDQWETSSNIYLNMNPPSLQYAA
jgi:transposase-like protein